MQRLYLDGVRGRRGIGREAVVRGGRGFCGAGRVGGLRGGGCCLGGGEDVEVCWAGGVVVPGYADGEGGVAVFYSGEDVVPEVSVGVGAVSLVRCVSHLRGCEEFADRDMAQERVTLTHCCGGRACIACDRGGKVVLLLRTLLLCDVNR